MRRCWIIGLFSLVTALVLLTASCSRTPEPVYAGKPVTQWLNAGQEDLCQAIHEIGLPALPYILDKLAREDPQFGSRIGYFKIWRQIPTAVRQALPRPGPTSFDVNRASSAILELGPAVTLELTKSLTSPNRAVREVSAQALGVLGRRGKNIGIALPSLEAASRDRCPQVASQAMWALRGLAQSQHD